ncbi:MAG: hypothetical protein HYX32_01305 [Actinobacteria bacterium]|nr:hypothetical protein [Actinomycetota bacterium]
MERAAEAPHVSASAFLPPPSAAAAFPEALAAPAAVNQRLATALQRPRKFRWLD